MVLSRLKRVAQNISNLMPVNVALNPSRAVRSVTELITKKSYAPSQVEKKIDIMTAVPTGAVLGGAIGGPKGALVGASVLPAITSASYESPKVQKFIQEGATKFLTGETQAQTGKVIGELAEGTKTPKDLSIKDIAKTAGLIGIGGAAAVGGVKAWDWWKNRDKTQETDSFTPQTPVLPDTSSLKSSPTETGGAVSVATPSVPTGIRNNIRINIDNRASATGRRTTNKRYINKRVYKR